jgi:hypothetical protein
LKGERAIVGVEHHLLRLARIGPHEQHPAVAQPDMRHFHRHCRAVDQHDLLAPVELISLARGKAERNERANRCRRPIALPDPSVAPNGIVPAFVTKPAERLENSD